MPTAYQHRPMSAILAPTPGTAEQVPTVDKTAADKDSKQPANELPEKYRGKSVEEVVEMHRNAEQRLGQLQNEVGQMRGLVSDLSAIQRPAAPQTVEREEVTVSGDEILSDPVSAVRKIVKQDFDAIDAERQKAAADTLLDTESRALLDTFGDINAIVSSDDFQKFAGRTPSRQADFVTAGTGEGIQQVRAARRLLEDYTDFKASTQTKEPTPTERARAVATEGSGTGAPISPKSQIFESDVIALINSDRAKYNSPSFQKDLMAAIKEGRFVKNA